MTQGGTATVTPLSSQQLAPGMKWRPIQGEEATGVLARGLTDPSARHAVLESAAEILGRGVDPKGEPSTEVGLIVGYVQSGKTLSFTTAIGLARDNGFPLVIVVAGTKTSLLAQSASRLAKDLNVESDVGAPVWRPITNPSEEHKQTIKRTIDDWSDPDLDSDERATLLITVLKQRDRLESLVEILEDLDLQSVPALIVDDEADQASLNVKVRQGGESTTYTWLRRLRAALPFHTYLQYTATPQAPLLINIRTALSPDFVHVLQPGDGYVGGAQFFAPRSPYVEAIPAAEVFADDALPTEPPDSLLEALRIFIVALSATLIVGPVNGVRQRRSMLMHPSRIRDVHRRNHNWATSALNEWGRVLKLPNGTSDKDDLYADFRAAFNELQNTDQALPPFEVIADKLPRAIRRTHVIEFNTNGRPKTPEIKWKDADGWILVGGQAVDRGFTVDSLNVTYMPRGLGVGNADSIQQRARFFGYKRRYLGLCRIYLEAATLQAFEKYVVHEEIMRRELTRVAETGESLKSWQRRFILSSDMQPCRNSVISLGDEYIRGKPGGGWIQQRGAELTSELRTANGDGIRKLIESLQFDRIAAPDPRSTAQQHEVSRQVALERIVDFLIDYQLLDPRDTAAVTGLLLQCGEVLRRDPSATASVYRMRPAYQSQRGRAVTEGGTLKDSNFLQGRTGDGTTGYPGDAFFKSPDQLTIQLHSYPLFREENGQRIPVADNAPLIAVHAPANLGSNDWIIQPRQV